MAEIESDRLLAAQKLVQRYGGTVVLKGAGTVIVDESDALALVDVGNPGMASDGMGDVLSGIIGALLGQNCHATQRLALAVQRGTRGMLATDLMPVLSRYLNPEWIPLEKTE